MSLKMPVTKRKIQNHFQYGFWKYLILLVIALFGWNLIYTTTRYQSPPNLKVEFYAESSIPGEKDPQALADQIHQEIMPEMEEVTATTVTYDDTYGDMQLVVWVSAGQGDIYLLSDDRFDSMSENEAMMDLQPYVDSGALNVDGLDLTGGYVKDSDTGKTVLLGIPADDLPGLADYGLLTTDADLCILANNGNDEYSVKFLNYLLTHMRASDEADSTGESVLPKTTFTASATTAP
ncbi:MAG: hypothetical protein PHY64_11780 [Eubacteriales bacterium]|nr:hypothetical protein [Eubacteriales bacterium]